MTYPATDTWSLSHYGSLPGVISVLINGNNGATTSSFEPIWPESAAYTVLAAAMSTPYIASSSANDTAAGTGTRTVKVEGIDTSYVAFSEILSTNGLTSVNLATANVLFINKTTQLTAGSGLTNAGIIRVGTGSNTSGVPAVVHSHMAVGFGQSQTAMYAVPASKTLLIRNITASSYGVTAGQTVEVVADIYNSPVTSLQYTRRFFPSLSQAGSSGMTYPGMIKVSAKEVIIFQALSAASTGPIMLQAECLLIDLATANTNQIYF